MKLAEILSGLGVVRSDASGDLEIAGLAYDSRQIKPGYLFFAVPGFKVDGHSFLSQARAAGAAAAITERWLPEAGLPQLQVASVRQALALAAANFNGRPSERLTTIGVTGTNGKTTTTFLIDAILQASGRRAGLLGGVEYRLGERVLAAKRTTPEALELQAMFAEMVAAGVDAVTLEVSSHGIDLSRSAYVDFDIAVFTNLTQDHLDLHQNMESYFQSKRRLFAGAPADGDLRSPSFKAVINRDDPYGRRLAEELAGRGGRLVTFGLEGPADVTAKRIKEAGWRTDFELVTGEGSVAVSLQLPGRYNLANALAAAAAASALGLPLAVIAAGLNQSRGAPGRFERVAVEAPFAVAIDYAHNEDGLAQALATARGLTDEQLVLVFGCPGERDRDKRPRMGQIAGRLADLAILTTDDCYGEPPEQILDEAEPGLIAAGATYRRIPDRRQAIEAALAAAGPGDLVLIAGKGHETSQMMASGAVPFSDRQVVLELLRQN